MRFVLQLGRSGAIASELSHKKCSIWAEKMNILKTLLMFSICALLGACFVGFPSSGPSYAREFVGQTTELKEDTVLVNYFGELIAWPEAEKEKIGSNQKVELTLPKGTTVKIDSIKSYRMPSGIEFSYKCTSEKPKAVFSVPFKRLKLIGIPLKEGA